MALIQVNYPSSSNYEMKVEAWESNVNIARNTSVVIADLYIRRKTSSSGATYNNYGTNWGITIDGVQTTGNKRWDLRNSSDWKYIGSASKEIEHNADGTKVINISAYHVGNTGSMGTASGNANMTLTTIPRTSKITLSKNTFNIGETITINTNRASSSFTHIAEIVFDGKSIRNQTGIGANYSWNTTELFSIIPTKNGATGKITLKTYSGSTLIGSSSLNYTGNIINSNPDFNNFDYEDTNSTTIALTGNNKRFIKRYSNIKTIITSANKMIAKNGATARSYNVIAGNKSDLINYSNSQVTSTINNMNANTVSVFAVDSRNNQTQAVKSLNVIDYKEPFLESISFERKNGVEERVLISGHGTWDGINFGQVENAIDSFVFRMKNKSSDTWSSWYSILNLFDINSDGTIRNKTSNEFTGVSFTFGNEYDIQVKIQDKLATHQRNIEVSSGKILMSALKGKGVAFGGIYDDNQDDSTQIHNKIILPQNKYIAAGGAIDMRNSDIINANAIWMADESTGTEGINFLKQGGDKTKSEDYETLRGYRDQLYYNNYTIRKNNVITVRYARHSQTLSTAWAWYRITGANGQNSIGDKLSRSNNTVVIGAGVSKVKVSAHTTFDISIAGDRSFAIRKNGSPIASPDPYPYLHGISPLYFPFSITETIVDVAQGNYIDLAIMSQYTNNITELLYAILTVEVIL